MKTINQVSGFSKERFLQVSKRFWVLNQKKWLIGFAGGVGIMILVYLLNSTGPTANFNSGIAVVGVGLTLYKFGGYLLTSGIFNEFGKKSSASQMLTLPASTFEKFLAGWFLTYFLYSVVVIVLLYLVSLVFGVNPVLSSLQLSDPNIDLSNANFLDALLSYTALHSVFFLGSIFFKGNNFLKTLLSIILFFITIGLFALLIQIIFPGEVTETVFFPNLMGISETIVLWIGTIFKLGITALFLFLSYRQLQNRQIA